MGAVRRPEPAARAMPGVILQFLERASVALAATRDAALVPRIHWVSGWQVDPDQASIWCFVPKEFAEGLPAAAQERAPFALTVEHIGPHECYQFKGPLREWRPATEADRVLTARCRERFSAAVRGLLTHLAGEDVALRRYILEPALALRLDVREIFLQTPGPGAGSLMARVGEMP